MTYEEFTTKLNQFDYKNSSYVANDMEFISWRLMTPDRLDDITHVSIGYVMYDNVIRQQFGQTPDVVKIHKHVKGTSGFWSDFTYEDAIKELIDMKLLSTQALRHNKLIQLGI